MLSTAQRSPWTREELTVEVFHLFEASVNQEFPEVFDSLATLHFVHGLRPHCGILSVAVSAAVWVSRVERIDPFGCLGLNLCNQLLSKMRSSGHDWLSIVHLITVFLTCPASRQV